MGRPEGGRGCVWAGRSPPRGPRARFSCGRTGAPIAAFARRGGGHPFNLKVDLFTNIAVRVVDKFVNCVFVCIKHI